VASTRFPHAGAPPLPWGREQRDAGTPSPPNDRPLMVLLGCSLVLALETGAAFVTWRLGNPRFLGAPIAVVAPTTRPWLIRLAAILAQLGLAACLVPRLRTASAPLLALAVCGAIAGMGPIYPPHALIVWQARFGRRPGVAGTLHAAWAVTAAVALAGSWSVILFWRRRRAGWPSASHGSARWGRGEALGGERGLVLGRSDRSLLRLDGPGHVLTVAPTRSGKGVSCVIPNLLDYPGSVVVTDPKGENYAVTARWRRAEGHAVHALDPFDVVGGTASYNPMELVDPASPDVADDARLLADMLILPEGREGEQAFWNEEARALLTGLMLHVAASAPPELCTLTHVRRLLTLPPDAAQQLLADMRLSEACHGLVARAAARLLQKAERERSGVVSTAQSHTHFLDSPRMARALGASSLDFGSLKRDRVSVYLILPAERLDGYARWLRLMIACGLLATSRTQGQPEERVLFLLDEFAHLRRMHPVQRDIGLAGGYGVRFWLVLQDLSQLRSTYSDTWPTFLANCDVLQAFGTNDWDTAEYLSKMTGETTVRVTSENRSTGVSHGMHPHRQYGNAISSAESGRRLLLPDEVRRLPGWWQLLFVKGSEPLLVRRVSYLADPILAGRADPNPLYAPVAVAAGEARS
jgi:type IV secretion system protein VirD4